VRARAGSVALADAVTPVTAFGCRRADEFGQTG
jgi:hypothetical protein